jgi:RNA polymerase sigma-70 factor, ECF subfamily
MKPFDVSLHLKDGSVLTDMDLVRAAQKCDSAAFRELVSRYENRVYRLALKMVHDPQDAEDALQDTFLSTYRHLDSFRGDSSFSTWIYRIAANACLMKIRKRKPMASLDEPVTAGETESRPTLIDWSATPEEMLLSGETRMQMDQALAALPETLRAVFVLRDIEGLSSEETSQVLDISVPNVKTRLHRARLAVREHLAEYLFERVAVARKEPAQ